METSRDDFVIAVRSAFLKKGAAQRFSLLGLIIFSLILLSLEFLNFKPINIFRSISKDVISNCHQCESPFDTHVNCANVNCNLLFLQCDKCKIKYKNCCSKECIETVNLPVILQKELRKGSGKKKMYHSHKKIKLNIDD